MSPNPSVIAMNEQPDEPSVKYIDVREFREQGYLQEVNRRFLHPLGLALEVTVEDDGTERLSGIWDYREDAEGIYFSGHDTDRARKAEHIHRLWDERRSARVNALGFMVQPSDG